MPELAFGLAPIASLRRFVRIEGWLSMPWWILGFCILSSLGSLLCAALLLLLPSAYRQFLLPHMISFATGTLLASAFLSLIPSGLAEAAATPFMATCLAGILLFFLLERFVRWHRCPAGQVPAQNLSGPLILVGDAFHNFVDGVAIAAAFMTSVPLGITISLAVLAHEIPQELCDFVLLLDSGFSRLRALTFNLISALAAILGSVIAYLALIQTQAAVPYILALSAASFLYIAMADLMPLLHQQVRPRALLAQLVLLAAGIAMIARFHLD